MPMVWYSTFCCTAIEKCILGKEMGLQRIVWRILLKRSWVAILLKYLQRNFRISNFNWVLLHFAILWSFKFHCVQKNVYAKNEKSLLTSFTIETINFSEASNFMIHVIYN